MVGSRHAPVFLPSSRPSLLAATALSPALAADNTTKVYRRPARLLAARPAHGIGRDRRAGKRPARHDPGRRPSSCRSIPTKFKGTNLGNASVSVGVSKDPTIVAACGTGQAAQGEKPDGTATLGGIKFTRFTFEDAGAGNRYASTVYRGNSDGNCYEVVEFLHWAAIENFSPGAVKEFDRATIEAELNTDRAQLRHHGSAALIVVTAHQRIGAVERVLCAQM